MQLMDDVPTHTAMHFGEVVCEKPVGERIVSEKVEMNSKYDHETLVQDLVVQIGQ